MISTRRRPCTFQKNTLWKKTNCELSGGRNASMIPEAQPFASPGLSAPSWVTEESDAGIPSKN